MLARNKRKLLPLTATKARPLARAYVVWDASQAGLGLRVQPTGHRSYVLVYRYHNRPRWFTIGSTTAIALADARQLAAELMLEVIRGKDVAAKKRAGRQSATFGALAERYLEEHAKRKNKSWREPDKLVRRYLLPAWDGLSAASITRSDVRALVGKINAPVQANQVLAAASAIFTWTVRQEIVPFNPCRGVERNATTSRDRVLSDSELPLFWRAFNEAGMPGVALKVLLLTGQRPGEVARMRHEHITAGWWTLPGAPDAATGWRGTKNAQSHRVWLPTMVRDILADLGNADDSGFVFGKVPRLTDAMRAICARLGVPRATPHDLRRTHGSTVTRLGFGREAMNRVQNHKEGGVTDVYDRHSYSDENMRVMEAVAAHLLTLALR